MASAVIRAPSKSKGASSSGRAGISLDLSATRRCATTTPRTWSRAASRCGAGLSSVRAPRMVSPVHRDHPAAGDGAGARMQPGGQAGIEAHGVQVLQDPADGGLATAGPARPPDPGPPGRWRAPRSPSDSYSRPGSPSRPDTGSRAGHDAPPAGPADRAHPEEPGSGAGARGRLWWKMTSAARPRW